MKTKRKLLITSVASLMLLSTVVVGSTFALFTSKSETNITVTTGKVSVVSEATNLKTYSPAVIPTDHVVKEYIEDTGTFVNGGTATLTANELVLDKLTPGDKVSFDIHVGNESNVNIKYRVLLTEANPDSATNDSKKLFSALKFKLAYGEGEATEYENIIKYQSAWKTLAAEGAMDNAHIEIELPTTADNVYQGLSTSIKYVIEAVQGNAATEGEELVEHFSLVTTSSDILAEAAELKAGETKTVRVDANIEDPVSLDVAEGATLNIDLNNTSMATEKSETFQMSIRGSGSVNVSNGTLSTNTPEETVWISEQAKVTFTDCVIENKVGYSGVPAAVYIGNSTGSTSNMAGAEINFENCTISSPNGVYGVSTNGAYSNGVNISFTNCNIDSKYALFLPSDGNYSFKDTNVTGYSVICGGNTTIDGGTFKQKKASSVTNSKAGGNHGSAPDYSKQEGRNIFDETEAKAYLSGVASGAGCLFDTVTVIDNRSGYNFRGISITNATVGVDAKTTAEDVIFGIRYINLGTDEEAHPHTVTNCKSLNDLTEVYSVDYFAKTVA